MNDRIAIESIPLYTHLDRINSGLAALGVGAGDPIRPESELGFRWTNGTITAPPPSAPRRRRSGWGRRAGCSR